jgi:hypothetical protein
MGRIRGLEGRKIGRSSHRMVYETGSSKAGGCGRMRCRDVSRLPKMESTDGIF